MKWITILDIGASITVLLLLLIPSIFYITISLGQNQSNPELYTVNQQTSTVKPNSKSTSANNTSLYSSPKIVEQLHISSTSLGTEQKHKDDWITANHDIFGTRNSNQTIIGKDNINKLQVKWVFHSDFTIENPPLIVGDTGYIQDNGMRVMAFDVNTGLNVWKHDLNGTPAIGSHGLTYDNGVIFAGTGSNATVVALNATNGKLIWQSSPVGPSNAGYSTPGPPTVWKDVVIAGQALGDIDYPPVQGKITAFNRTNGEKIWSTQTTVGSWVEGKNATINGGAATWSGGSLDPKTGIYYVPTGNPSPGYNDTSRPGPNPYSGSMLAIDARTGHIKWTRQLVAPNTKDWDAGLGASLATISSITTTSSSTNNNIKSERVIVHGTKRGDAYALDAGDGNIIWKDRVGIQRNTEAQNVPNGTSVVWPGPAHGVEAYTANDNETAYFAVSNMGYSFSLHGNQVQIAPVFNAIANGVGNGTITAIEIKTGNIKWIYPTEFPTRVSPLVTNGIVFSGHMTATGTPYKYDSSLGIVSAPLNPSGIIFALDKYTGKRLWEFNVGAPIGIGGPSIGHGMLFVTTGFPNEIAINKGGDIVAFGLPVENVDTGAKPR